MAYKLLSDVTHDNNNIYGSILSQLTRHLWH